jgi:hypothetical protein
MEQLKFNDAQELRDYLLSEPEWVISRYGVCPVYFYVVAEVGTYAFIRGTLVRYNAPRFDTMEILCPKKNAHLYAMIDDAIEKDQICVFAQTKWSSCVKHKAVVVYSPKGNGWARK